MVKHIRIIRRQQPANCLSVFDHFVGLALKGLINVLISSQTSLKIVFTDLVFMLKRKNG